MSIRRWAGAVTVLVLGVTTGLAAPPAAHAAVGSAVLGSWDYVSVPSGCANALTGTEPGDVTVKADGAWRTVRLRRSGTLSSSAVSGATTVTGRIATDSRGSTKVGIKVSASATAKPRSPSICAVDNYAVDATVSARQAVTPARSWLVVRSSGSTRGSSQTGFGSPDVTGGFVALGRSLTKLVPAGTYTLGGGVDASVNVPANSTTARSAAASATATVALFPIGTLRARSGDGLGYVKAGHRDCTHNRVKAYFSDAARTSVRSATFSVDGQRRFTLTGSQLQRDAVFVSSVPRASSGAIRVDILLRSGARRTSYATSWPCA
ncbi:hypothetical protein [Nocardioides aromaticivorans]|uniref:hypothetical protein n=1 Tax=Nocardioides aromaticivorans TaxID=200618 RepID=UPI001A8F1EB8|nr:hypothetical protein [Nocardioides aromaticivorans]